MNNDERILALLGNLSTQVGTLTTRMDKMSTQVDTLTTRMDKMSTQVDTLTTRMDKMSTQVDTLTTRMDKMSADMADVKSDVAELKTRVTKIEVTQENVILPRLQTLAEGQEALHEQIRRLSVIDRLQDDVITLKSAVRYLSEKVEKLEQEKQAM